MKWTPGGESQDIEDRRDEGGGGGFQFGGKHIGIGGALILLILSFIFRTNLFTLLGGGTGDPAASRRRSGCGSRWPGSEQPAYQPGRRKTPIIAAPVDPDIAQNGMTRSGCSARDKADRDVDPTPINSRRSVRSRSRRVVAQRDDRWSRPSRDIRRYVGFPMQALRGRGHA